MNLNAVDLWIMRIRVNKFVDLGERSASIQPRTDRLKSLGLRWTKGDKRLRIRCGGPPPPPVLAETKPNGKHAHESSELAAERNGMHRLHGAMNEENLST